MRGGSALQGSNVAPIPAGMALYTDIRPKTTLLRMGDAAWIGHWAGLFIVISLRCSLEMSLSMLWRCDGATVPRCHGGSETERVVFIAMLLLLLLLMLLLLLWQCLLCHSITTVFTVVQPLPASLDTFALT